MYTLLLSLYFSNAEPIEWRRVLEGTPVIIIIDFIRGHLGIFFELLQKHSPSRCILTKATDQHHEHASRCTAHYSPLARLVSGLQPSRWGPSGWTTKTWLLSCSIRQKPSAVQVNCILRFLTIFCVFFFARSVPGVLKFGFGMDVLPRNLKVDPYKYQFFKWPIHVPIGLILGQTLSKIIWFFKNVLNLIQFWFEFGKIVKNWPIHIPNFAFYRGLFKYQEADYATHVGGTTP